MAGGGFVSEKEEAGVSEMLFDEGAFSKRLFEGAPPRRSPSCGRFLARARAVKGVSPHARDPGLSPTVGATDMLETLFVEASKSDCFTWFRF